MSKIITLENNNINENIKKFCGQGLEEVMYTYTDEFGFAGIYSLLNGLDELTSIEDLKNDYHNQCGIGIGIIPKPWGENRFIACKEGVFIWDWGRQDYALIGHISSIVRQKRIAFARKTYIVHDQKKLQFELGESYLIVGEFVSFQFETMPIIIFVIEVGSNLVEIPYDDKSQTIAVKDLAMISFFEKPIRQGGGILTLAW
ncbi:hypothetical protein [Paenibacillus sp. EPM92]|uniref:hypothetical protein n=1 Tax=Paenibacillus sp. EPM92 TaxID=1561195 RepID=UPI001914E009|nr:hypothetical protein [Paenibacillus sp. EPM92]